MREIHPRLPKEQLIHAGLTSSQQAAVSPLYVTLKPPPVCTQDLSRFILHSHSICVPFLCIVLHNSYYFLIYYIT